MSQSSTVKKKAAVRLPFSQTSLAVVLLLSDVIGLVLAYALYMVIRQKLSIGWQSFYYLFLANLIVFLTFYILDLYKTESVVMGLRTPGRAILGTFVSHFFIMVILFQSSYSTPLKEGIGTILVVTSMCFMTIWTSFWRMAMFFWSQSVSKRVRWLVVGNSDENEFILSELRKNDPVGEFVFFSENSGWKKNDLDLLDRNLQEDWSGIVVLAPQIQPSSVLECLMHARLQGTRVYDIIDYYENYCFKVPIFQVRSGWFALSHGFDLLHNPVGLRIKRVMDLTMATLLLTLTLPFFPLIAFVIKMGSPGPIFYKQTRTGENGRPFLLYKFRTMRSDAEKDGAQWARSNDSRVTRVGKILRLTRIDELPQLWNVFNGEMSFIGPRPERPEFNDKLEKEIPYYDFRHLLKPGITGWAQVLQGYTSTIDDVREKLQYDLYYIKNYNLFLDVAIIFKTIRVMVLGQGR